jgi:hypothetical protein
MSGQNEQQVTEQAAPTKQAAATQDADGAAPAAASETTPKGFVPYFNEEYEFKLGDFGDLGPAMRLSIAFGFMLAAAGLLYCATWWWVGFPPASN